MIYRAMIGQIRSGLAAMTISVRLRGSKSNHVRQYGPAKHVLGTQIHGYLDHHEATELRTREYEEFLFFLCQLGAIMVIPGTGGPSLGIF